MVRLDRSVRAILSKLEMPSLESFGPGSEFASLTATKTTRENSRETTPNPESKSAQYDIAGAPMEGLYEATHLSALRSRTGGPPTERRLRKNIESDLIAQGIISVDEAERMLTLYIDIHVRVKFLVLTFSDSKPPYLATYTTPPSPPTAR